MAEDQEPFLIPTDARYTGRPLLPNGLALVKLRPCGATFLLFSDYAKPALRLSALRELPAIYIFTNDSIGVREDGSTHQPVEQGLIALHAAIQQGLT